MTAMWAPTVTSADSFLDDVETLRGDFPEIDACLEDFEYVLRSYWTITHFPVDPESLPNVYAEKLDYPAFGPDGAGVLLVTYHAADGNKNPMQGPTRAFTLLSITRAQ